MNPVTRTIAVGLVAVILLIAGVLMGGPSEIEAAQDVSDYSDELAAAQYQMSAHPELMAALNAAEPGTDKFNAAAASLCRHTNGDAAQLLTLANGMTACRRAGAVDVAQGSAQ